MNWSDDTTKGAEYTMYVTPAGVDLQGNRLFTLADFFNVRLNDNTDSTGNFILPSPWYNPLGDSLDNQIRFRLEQLSGAFPAPQSTDTDQRALHFIGPI